MTRKFAAALPMILLACSGGTAANGQSSAKPFKTEVVADFDAPWAMTFLPDASMIVTEKDGRMIRRFPGGLKVVTATINVDSAGQGALMDVVPAPDFLLSNILYFSYSTVDKDGRKGVVLARGTMQKTGIQWVREPCPNHDRLKGITTIFRASSFVEGNGHYSGRIAFSPDGQYLFFTNGERQKFDPAQDPKSTLGKVLRLNLDGTPAKDNPLAAKGFHPAVWSYGHRNLLGLAFDAQGRLWEQEMGPQGGDEVNLIKPGLNYGWPRASNGTHYDGRDIPDHKAGDGYAAPKVWWNPSISPAGLIYYSGAMFPAWKNSLFLGGLSGKALIRIKLDGEKAVKADQWDMGARIREVEQGPDGALWVLEDGGQGSQGRLLKLTPT